MNHPQTALIPQIAAKTPLKSAEPTADQHREIFCTYRKRGVPTIFGSAIFLICFLNCIGMGQLQLEGVVLTWIAASALIVVNHIRESRLHGRQLVIDERGVQDDIFGYGLIPWEEIQQIKSKNIFGFKFLTIRVNDPTEYLARVRLVTRINAKMGRLFGLSHISFPFANVQPPLMQVWKFLRCYYLEVKRPTEQGPGN